jgi:DNA helicase-2/ATP-dependent DNA helicase PcrA
VAEKLWVGTFHSTGVRILRARGEAIGVDRNFSIYDAGDSQDLVKDIISRDGGHLLKSPRSIRDRISRWKNDLVTPELALEQVANNIDKRIVAIYREYERALRRSNALDFDDLISKVVELFSVSQEAKDYYAGRFRYILVDEFQDTNPIQMALIDALQSRHGNLFVVGDDDQSIYSWRGAKVEHILSFEDLYEDTRVIRLEQNYRSCQTILDAANQVIANNRGRKGKNLWTDGERGERVGLLVSMDEESEAMNVLHSVRTLVGDGVDLRDIAVLYRTNAQSRALEDVLKIGSLPYQIIGSVGFYERMEIRDLLAYCKLLANPADDISLKRIINVPRRAVGKATYEKLAAIGADRDKPVMEVLLGGGYDLPNAQIKRCAAFAQLFAGLQRIAEEKDAPQVIEAIIEQTAYRDHLRENYPDGDSRIENIEELISAAEVYVGDREDRSLRAFLEEIALVADIDSFEDTSGQLTLMTLHNAKGLEFDCIFIAGLEEGLFPHFNSLDSPQQLEEERRLFYVGMTRARKRLFCSYANMRRRMGVIEGGQPSRFLYEIPLELLDGTVKGPGFGTDELGLDQLEGFAQTGSGQEFEDISQEQVFSYAVGTRVHHDEFGRGVVRRVEGKGEDVRVTVIFDGGGERKFIAQYAPMRPI